MPVTLLLALFLAGPAQAASLDNLEIGGPWGTPTATGASAVWWNPAGLAASSGTRVMIEGAPLIGKVTYDRTDPYGYSGTDVYKSFGVVPFVGAATDFGVHGLGVGASVLVPDARGGQVVDEIPSMDQYAQDDPVPPTASFGRYHLRQAKVQAMYAMLGAAYEIQDRVAIGAGAALVLSSWTTRVDQEILSSLDAQIENQTGGDSGYTNDQVQDPHYATTAQFGNLTATGFTFNVGVRVKVIPDKLAVGISYVNGVKLDHKGDVVLHFNCPPESDALGRFAAQATGICYTKVNAAAEVAYKLPARLSASVLVKPIPAMDVTLLGGWVGWSAFDNYDITISDVAARNPDADHPDNLAAAVEKSSPLARANQDTYWGGFDVKGRVNPYLVLGGRLLFDHSAIPDKAVSPNNYDANDLMLTGLVAVDPTPYLEIGASLTQHILEKRMITDSGFGVNVEADGPKNDPRWFYPDANGTYTGSITRIGVQARLKFGPKDKAGDPDEVEL